MNSRVRHLSTTRQIIAIILATVCMGSIFGVLSASASSISFQTVRDCNTSAVINCGALSTGELISDYNKQAYVQNVYSGVGISGSSVRNLNNSALAGVVQTNGNIYIHNQTSPVASGVTALSRTNVGNGQALTYKGDTYYEVAPNLVFNGTAADVYIQMNGKNFVYAIIASNGDPLIPKPPVTKTVTPSAVHTQVTAKTPPLSSTGPATNVSVALFASAFIVSVALWYRRQLKRL